VARFAPRVVTLKDGRIVSDVRSAEPPAAADSLARLALEAA
jgi:hypothetical protein